MKEGSSIVRFVKEAVWGTTPGSPTWTTALLEGSGFEIADEFELVKLLTNSHFPVPRSQEPIKQKVAATYKTPLFPDSVEALIKMAVERDSANELYGYTWQKKTDYSQVTLTGGKVSSMTLEFPASGNVMLTLEWIFQAIAATTGIVAGTYPTGAAYKGGLNTVSVNSVAYATMESGQITLNNNLEEGPVSGAALTISFLDAGFADYAGNIKCKYASSAWEAFKRTLTNYDLTAFPAVLTLLNKTALGADANLVLTFAAGSLKAPRVPKEAGEQGKTVMETLELVHQTTAPTWTYPA